MINKLPVSEIKLNPNNPRLIKDDKFKKLVQSIKDFPEMANIRPVVLNKDYIILGGNMRFRAMKEAGWKEIPVAIVDLPEDKQREFVIKDNVSGGEWDWEMLANEWNTEQLDEWGLDLPKDMQEEPEIEEDEAPEVSEEEFKSKLGEIYQLGNHRVMCGDSTSIDDVEKLMDNQKADICFTSPPYNAGSLDIKGNARTQKKYNSFDDNQTEDEYKDFVISNLNCIFSVCNEVLYNIGLVEGNKRVIIDVLAHYREQFKDIIYWKKNNVAPHIQGGVINNLVEFILCFGDGKRKFQNAQFKQGSYYNVIEGSSAAGNEYSGIHKATFPSYLPENIINNFCPPKGSVLDTFGGTGTTMIAAEKLSRKSYLMELDPKYVDVIRKRWAKFVYPDTWEERWEELTPNISTGTAQNG